MKSLCRIRFLKLVVLIVVTAIALAGCGSSTYDEQVRSARRKHDIRYWTGIGDYSKLEAAADAFLEGTNECILDVRDRGITYERSANCAALATLSKAYIAAGGDAPRGEEPSVIHAKAQDALKYVWMARAISALGGGMQNAWVW